MVAMAVSMVIVKTTRACPQLLVHVMQQGSCAGPPRKQLLPTRKQRVGAVAIALIGEDWSVGVATASNQWTPP